MKHGKESVTLLDLSIDNANKFREMPDKLSISIRKCLPN